MIFCFLNRLLYVDTLCCRSNHGEYYGSNYIISKVLPTYKQPLILFFFSFSYLAPTPKTFFSRKNLKFILLGGTLAPLSAGDIAGMNLQILRNVSYWFSCSIRFLITRLQNQDSNIWRILDPCFVSIKATNKTLQQSSRIDLPVLVCKDFLLLEQHWSFLIQHRNALVDHTYNKCVSLEEV